VFLLRGMAVVLPLAIVLTYETWSRGFRRGHVLPALCAVAIALVPIGAWMLARYRIDEWRFLHHLFWYDAVARATSNIEDHPGSVFYYLNVLVKYHYDWLLAALVALLLFPVTPERWREAGRALWAGSGPLPLLASWAVVATAIPTAMTTKLAWYFHPFYPVFAIGVGAVLAQAVAAAFSPSAARWRRVAFAAVLGLVVGVAEGRLIYYSYAYRDLASSSQGLMLAERQNLKGRQIFGARWDRAEIFVAEALVGAPHRLAPDLEDFLRDSRPGDYYRTRSRLEHDAIVLVRSAGRAHLYKRVE
jgi:4-amino-4-deoxy-L-arabinose transferase-like glycosyltransferase